MLITCLCVCVRLCAQVFEEHDEDVQDAEAAEAPATREERDSELRPVHHKAKEHGAGGEKGEEEGEEDEDDDDDDVSVHVCVRWRVCMCVHVCVGM